MTAGSQTDQRAYGGAYYILSISLLFRRLMR